ncbi:MAG: hypothetical protein HZA67_07720 [Rhodospirillales bacterium]|nr:hypothetical protein [Rhodospirillales bacterium]
MFRPGAARRNAGSVATTPALGQSSALSTHMDVRHTKAVINLSGLTLGVRVKIRLLQLFVGDVLKNRQLVQNQTVFAICLRRIVVFLGHSHSPLS